MKKTILLSGLVVMFLAATVSVQAQKFGYINTAEILAELPAVKQAETEIENFSKQLQKKGEAEVAKLQQKFTDFQQKVQSGAIAPVEQERMQTEIQKDQAELQQMEADMVGQIQQKRQDALKPIYDKLNAAISAVAKENGYTMIFDKAVLLYSEDKDDVSAMVKAKL